MRSGTLMRRDSLHTSVLRGFLPRSLSAVVLAILVSSAPIFVQGIGAAQVSGSMAGGMAGQSGTDLGSGQQGSSTAQSLIIFLNRHPDMLALARMQVAQSMGVDPQTLTGQQVFDTVDALIGQIDQDVADARFVLNGQVQ